MQLTPYQRTVVKMVDNLLTQVGHAPGGYMWQQQLPRKGKHSLAVIKRRWVRQLQQVCISEALLQAMVLACVSSEGIPEEKGKALYNWLVKHVYYGDSAKLHRAWYTLQQQHK
jgi:hypothetical protein